MAFLNEQKSVLSHGPVRGQFLHDVLIVENKKQIISEANLEPNYNIHITAGTAQLIESPLLIYATVGYKK